MEPGKSEREIYDEEYVRRFAKAKARAESMGLKYEYPLEAGVGWKIHLNVSPSTTDTLTGEIADFVRENRFDFKVGHGGENGKGMTIYIGDRDTLEDFSRALVEKFGDRIPEPRGDILTDDICVSGRVWARFENIGDFSRNLGDENIALKYSQYGVRGLPFLATDQFLIHWGKPEEKPTLEEARNRSRASLVQDYWAFFTGTRGRII